MNSMYRFLAALAVLTAASCTTQTSSQGDGSVDFVKDVKPLIADRCIMCHNREVLPGKTSFESRELALAGDKQGPVIIPGNASASRLITAVSAPDVHEQAMPPVSFRVSKSEADLLRRWIDEGASWPTGPAGRIKPTEIPLE